MIEIKAGQYVTDGTSVFILDDIRDRSRVVDIVLRPPAIALILQIKY